MDDLPTDADGLLYIEEPNLKFIEFVNNLKILPARELLRILEEEHGLSVSEMLAILRESMKRVLALEILANQDRFLMK